jgi:hypothetical protein
MYGPWGPPAVYEALPGTVYEVGCAACVSAPSATCEPAEPAFGALVDLAFGTVCVLAPRCVCEVPLDAVLGTAYEERSCDGDGVICRDVPRSWG